MLEGGAARERPWVWWALGKVYALVVVILLVISIEFVMFRVYESEQDNIIVPKTADKDFIEQVYKEFHLNESLATQYVDHVADTLTLDFHFSTTYRKGVEISEFIGDAVATTLLLFTAALVSSLALGIVYEAAASRLRRRISRRIMRLTSALMFAAPTVALAEAIFYVNSRLGEIAPVGPQHLDEGSILVKTVSGLTSAILPVLICALTSFGFITFIAASERHERPSRENLSENVKEVMSATNASPWFVKFYFAWVLCCVLAIEFMCGYDGLGLLMWRALDVFDAPVLMATFFLSTLILVTLNFAYDVFISPGFAQRGAKTSFDGMMTGRISARSAKGTKLDLIPSAKRIFADYRKSRTGMIALIVLLAFVVIALFAPLLSTVGDPHKVENWEENDEGLRWFNPHPPSLSPSPVSGLRHPLGTDLYGQDVYSMMVYGARGPVLAGAIIGLLSLGVGMISGIASVKIVVRNKFAHSAIRWLAVIMADAFVAIPLFAFLAGILIFQINNNVDSWTLAIFVVVAIQPWALTYVVHQTRRTEIRHADGSATNLIPTILRRSLFVTKFSVASGVALILTLAMVGLHPYARTASWAEVLKSVLHSGALCCFETWWTIFPPLLASMIFIGSAFVVADTLERVIRTREDAAAIDQAQASPITAA